MEINISQGRGYDYVKVLLYEGEEVYAQPGSLMYKKGDLRLETKSFGGFLGGIKKSLLGGESFFVNRFIANSPSELWFSPSFPGEIHKIELSGNEMFIRDGAYLLHAGNVEIDTKFFGLKGFLSGGGLVWLNAKGYGKVFINAYGAVEKIHLENETIMVDNYNLLAADTSLNISLKSIGGLKSLLFGGEGFLFEISGTGDVYLQTCSLSAFAYELIKILPNK